jgi:hypothetical protein
VLREEAEAAGLPTDRISVIGADRLTKWCNEHPAVASAWAGRPGELKQFEAWALMEVHSTPWQTSAQTESLLQELRAKVDLRSGELVHLHIQGPPGVGKSRFALEICRSAEWKNSVIYFANATDYRLQEIIQAAVNEPAVQLVVVADEAQFDQLLPLRDALDGSGGRVRLISIGHSDSPDPARVPAQPIAPLPPDQMRGVVSAWHPAMPREYVDFVVQFADGFIRLAKLAADAVARDPGVDVRNLLKLSGIRSFLDKMLGTADRRHLYVVASLASVGWRDEAEVEGKAIAEHFGWAWNDVRATVESFDRSFGIVPRGGRYRYISPKPLAVYLAVEAWETYPDLLKRLPEVLPTEDAVRAYNDRLQTIASNPQAKQFSTEQLKLFFSIEDFIEPLSINRWAAFAAANPSLAAKSIVRALEGESVDRRREILGESRRTAVWTLVKLAWMTAAFHDATLALALLAEAENETWGNNATGEFRARFMMYLGGTPVRYLNRLTVIDQIISTGRSSLLQLAASALGQVGSQDAHRTEIPNLGDEAREPEWQPRSGAEHTECIKEALSRLKRIANEREPALSEPLVTAADQLAMLLRYRPTRPLVLDYYEAIRDAHPSMREPIRRIIERILQSEKLYWKELEATDLEELEVAMKAFEDSALTSRLQQYVGHATLIKEEQADLTPLAEELLSDPSLIIANWPWLTSGQAADAWRFGFTLGSLDEKGSLEQIFGGLDDRGPDLRLLSGYVEARRNQLGMAWFDEWIQGEMRRDPEDFPLLFEIVARVNPTEKSARLVETALRTRRVEPNLVGMLTYGVWSSMSVDVLKDVLTTVADTGYEETAISVLYQRLKDHPDEIEKVDSLATRLATLPKLIRSNRNQMTNFYWENVALAIAPKHPFELASAVFATQAERETRFMAEYSGAKNVIIKLVELDAGSVWRALAPHLTSRSDALLFVIGFPHDVVDRVPPQQVIDWIQEEPEERSAIIAHLASKDFSTDETLASRILGQFGHSKRVADAFFSNFIGGVFGGAASAHWESLAVQLDAVSNRTHLPQLSRWAVNSAASLRNMAEQEKQREDEEQIRSH